MSRSVCTAARFAAGLVLAVCVLARGGLWAQEPTAVSPTTDVEALRKLIREEVKEEMKAQAEEKKKQEEEWIEVGRDRQLDPSWLNGFVAESKDKAFRVHIGGRLEFDNTWFTQDNNILIGSSPDQRLMDGTLFRRARLHTKGLLWEFVDFTAEMNFANIQDVSNVDNQVVQIGSVGLSDCFVTFRDLPILGNARFGHLKAPVGLERYSSANTLNYMERSTLFDAFYSPVHRQNGLLLFNSYLDDRVTLACCLAWVDKATIQSFGFGAFDTGQYGASARVSALPICENEGRTLMHVAAGYQHLALSNTFAVANRPLLRSGAGSTQTPNLLFTGNFFTPNGADLVDVEWAMILGRFSASAEYAVVWAGPLFDSFDGTTFAGSHGNVTYQAAYVEAGWFLLPGDSCSYDRKTGTWGRPVVQENAFAVRGEDGTVCYGRGAVQLVARYTYLDLLSGSPVVTPDSGGARAGRQQDVNLGLNWYINSQTWFLIDYVWTHLDSAVAGASGNLQGVGCRLHIDF